MDNPDLVAGGGKVAEADTESKTKKKHELEKICANIGYMVKKKGSRLGRKQSSLPSVISKMSM